MYSYHICLLFICRSFCRCIAIPETSRTISKMGTTSPTAVLHRARDYTGNQAMTPCSSMKFMVESITSITSSPSSAEQGSACGLGRCGYMTLSRLRYPDVRARSQDCRCMFGRFSRCALCYCVNQDLRFIECARCTDTWPRS